MNRNLFLLVIASGLMLSFYFVNGTEFQSSHDSWSEYDHLKGKVRTVTYIKYNGKLNTLQTPLSSCVTCTGSDFVYENFGVLPGPKGSDIYYKGGSGSGRKVIEFYSKDGRKVRSSGCNVNGDTTEITTFEYNADGSLKALNTSRSKSDSNWKTFYPHWRSEFTYKDMHFPGVGANAVYGSGFDLHVLDECKEYYIYNGDHLMNYVDYNYNQAGALMVITRLNGNRKQMDSTVYIYNGKGRVLEREYYSDNKLLISDSYEYEQGNRPIKRSSTDHTNGKVSNFEYFYDGSLNIKSYGKYEFAYVYDETGNWLSREGKNISSNTYETIERVITYW